MNVDDLMEIWRSQDPSPLHRVDKTLLHLALRQEQAKLQRQRGWETWFIYIMSAILLAAMGLSLGIMIYPNDDDVLAVWDYAIPVVGAAAALVMAGAMYATYRARMAHDQGFGESLRDQLRRRIAQLDDLAVKERRLARVIVAATLIGGAAVYVAGRRINDVAYSEDWPVMLGLFFLGVILVEFWRMRRSVQRALSRKRRLEALLKELDGQQ
jgi:hypothetical protein